MITFWACFIIFAFSFTWIRRQANNIKRLEEEKEQLIESMEPEAKAMLLQISTDIHGIRGEMVEIKGEMSEMKFSVEKIDRGVYGEKENDNPGLFGRVAAIEKNMVSKKTVAGWVAGLSSGIAAIGHAIKEFVK